MMAIKKNQISVYSALFFPFSDNLVLIAILVTVMSVLSAITAFLILKKYKRYSIIALNLIGNWLYLFCGMTFGINLFLTVSRALSKNR